MSRLDLQDLERRVSRIERRLPLEVRWREGRSVPETFHQGLTFYRNTANDNLQMLVRLGAKVYTFETPEGTGDYVFSSRTINTSSDLSGGGTLAADLTLGVADSVKQQKIGLIGPFSLKSGFSSDQYTTMEGITLSAAIGVPQAYDGQVIGVVGRVFCGFHSVNGNLQLEVRKNGFVVFEGNIAITGTGTFKGGAVQSPGSGDTFTGVETSPTAPDDLALSVEFADGLSATLTNLLAWIVVLYDY